MTMASRPPNAPRGVPLSLGVQPGAPQIIRAQYVIIFGTAGGLFVYSGTPAAGNLIGSWAAAAGTDSYGNPYPAGLSIGGDTLPQVLLQPGSPHASLSFPLNETTAFTDPVVKGGAIGSPQYADLILSGPVHPTKTDQVHLDLNSSDGSSSANGALAYLTTGNVDVLVAYWDATGFAVLEPLRVGAQGLPATPSSGVILWADGNNSLQKLVPSGRYATLSDGSVSYASHTVTSSSLSVLTDTWIVPPNDAVAGTCYRLRAWGSGTQGSTAQQLNFVFSYNGANNAQAGLGSSSFAANEVFEWEAEMIAVVASTGTGGVITHKLSVHASSNSVGSTGAGGYSVIRTGSFAVDTTSQINLSLDFYWGSTTGAPTITGRGSLFERLGA